MRRCSRLLVLFSTLFLVAGGSAFGSGFAIPEQGAKAAAMGGAFVALADDPSAIYFNPAGLAQQRERRLLGGTTIINFSNEFRGDRNDAFTSGQDGFYRRHTFNIPNGYGIIPIGENLTFGAGLYAGYGLRTNWQEPWVGRFIAIDTNVKTVSVQPTLAWKTSDGRLALGGGLEYRRAKVILERNNGILNPFTQRFADVANVHLESDWEGEIGFNVGVIFKLNDRFRIGASHRSDMDIELTGEAEFTQIPTGSAQLDALVRAGLPPAQGIKTTVPFPAVTTVGVAVEIVPSWDVAFDVNLTTWGRFETLVIEFEDTPAINLARPQNWNDTYSYRLGANKRVNETWDVRFGALYDDNPQPDTSVGPLLPDSDRLGGSFGFGWRSGPLSAEFSGVYLHLRERNTNGANFDNFNGTYKTDATLFTVDFGLRF